MFVALSSVPSTPSRFSDSRAVMYEVGRACGWDVWGGGSPCYMTAHCVAPQQSLMMATPDLVMDGLLGGVSNACLFGFGASTGEKKGGKW